MTGSTTLRALIDNHGCAHPGCSRVGSFGTGLSWYRGAPNAEGDKAGLRPLVTRSGALWWCAEHRRPAGARAPEPPMAVARPRQDRLL